MGESDCDRRCARRHRAMAVICSVYRRRPFHGTEFLTGERLIVNKVLYDFREPKRGEVVVFHVPEENRDLIKRVIGVAGDTIEYRGDDLYVNGNKVEEPYIQEALDEAHKMASCTMTAISRMI